MTKIEKIEYPNLDLYEGEVAILSRVRIPLSPP